MAPDHLQQADEVLEKAAAGLHNILVALAAELDPFPFFLDSVQVQGVEAQPGGKQKAERGCIVVCRDGELYEFTMQIRGGTPFFDFDREDSVQPAELTPEEYIPYAYRAIQELSRLIAEQGKAPKPKGQSSSS